MPAPVIEWIREGVGFTPAAAASFRRAEADLGRRMDVNSSYRDYDQQMRMWRNWQAYVNGLGPHPGHSRALHPDASMHCQGLAVDSDDWRTPGFIRFFAEHGWIRTAAGDPTEQHHFEYQVRNDQHRFRPASNDAEPFEPVEDELSRAEVDELKEFIRTQGFDLHEETRRYAAGVPGNGADFVCYRRSDTPTDGVKRTYALYENTRKELFRVPVHNPSHLAALGDVKEMRRDVLLQYREWPSDGVNARPGVFQESVKSEDTGNVFDLFVDNKGHGVRRWIIDADEIASREATGVRAVSRAYILQFGPINQDTP